jgi:class 3 adenylate cyclase
VVAESVELATILLTDLVGSTRLATSVGPVCADQLREEHFELLRDAIASSGGREVKNTGDGLMVAFSSASAAVQCAVAVQQLFERRYRDAEQTLHVRVGLAAGESTVKDGDYFGMPSIEAARLCAEAPSDGILISGMAKALAGRCEGVEFSSAGELELKGFPDPVEAFSVTWAPLAEEAGELAGRWPLPALLRSVPPVKYVGRVQERAGLAEAMKLARSGQRQVVLLSGEPGIGKTRLASYAAHDADAEGFAVVWGACTEELAVPYEPWIGVCTQLVESAPDQLIRRHVKRHAGELLRLARNLAERSEEFPVPQSSDPETERYLLFNAVAGLLGEVAETVALCVVLDDLHWADAQSLALLKHVLRPSEQGALQVIVTYRDSDLGKDHPLTALLADLRSLQGVQRIALHGLGTDEVAEIISAVAGHELDQDGVELAARIAAETDGNPFFVGEILRGLSESGGLTFDEDTQRWSIDTSTAIALPESVREVIERRVERLGEESLEALRLAAVVGREFDLQLLSAVVEIDEGRLLDHLEAAVAASLLAESSERVGRFRFAHALINQTLYEGLGATRRARMHQRVAQVLEALYGANPGGHLSELALHWRLAPVSVNKAKAADYALKAGQRALENLAPAEAMKLFEDAVELIDDADSRERCEALIGLGEAQRQTGIAAYRDSLLEASNIASELGDAELAARAALANSRGYTSTVGERDEQRLSAIARAIELDEPPNPVRRAQLLALEAMELSWDPDLARRKALAEEALALARGAANPAALATVLQRAFNAIWSPETLEPRRGLAAELADCAATLGDPAIAFWAQRESVHSFVERGDLTEARDAAEQGHALADQLGQPALQWFDCFQRAGLELLHGDLAAGERLAEQAFQLGQEAGQPDAILIYGGQIAFIRPFQGRGGEVIEIQRQSVSAFAGVPAFRAGLAATLCWLDRHDEARPILEQASSDRFDHLGSTAATLTALALYAEAAFQASDTQASSILYDRLEPFADQVVWVGSQGYGHVRIYLGLLAACLGEHQRADEHLRFACEFHESNGMPLWGARGHLGWAEALAARGHADEARDHAVRAREFSREHGYGAFEPRAATLVETESTAGT